MNNLAKIGVLAFFAIFTLNIAAASPADLDIFPQESSTRIDSFTSYEVEITNTGTVDDVYDLSSSNPSEITIAPRQVPEEGTLEPGASETVQVWFNPDLDRNDGRYNFRITATSQASGDTFSTQGTVNVIREHDVSVEVESPDAVCRGEEASYRVFVENSGTQQETFRVNAEAGSLSTSTVTLESGETKYVTLTRSSDLAVTDNAFNIRAKSTSSYAEDVTSASFTVESCYESDTDINPQNQRTPALTEAEFEVRVVNQGTRSDEFTLSTNYGELEDSQFTLASGDSRTTTLSYTPETLEDRSIRVSAEGRSSSAASAELDVFNGQNVTVEFTESSENVCENTMFEKTVNVENTGVATDRYNVSTGDTVELAPGESRELEIDMNSSNYEVGETYDVDVSAQSQTFEETNAEASSSFTVENCYDLKLSVVPHVASAGENRSVLYEIRLNNPGTKRNQYHVRGEGPDWISVRPEYVTVDPGETEKSFIYAGIPYNQANGTFEITAVGEGEQVRKEQTVELVIGEDVQDAIKSDKGGGLTGMFSSSVTGAVKALTEASNLVKLGLSLLVGLIVSAAILAREW